jgi:hypothetical protein
VIRSVPGSAGTIRTSIFLLRQYLPKGTDRLNSQD